VPVTTTVSRRGSGCDAGSCAKQVNIRRGKTAKADGRNAHCTSSMLERMNWNDAAEDLLNQIVAQTPRPVREATETELRGLSEALAEEDGKSRVGVETVIAAWVRSTPETLREDLPRQMERFGLDPEEYRHLLA
jgi:Proto-chlorophyllide reductase 57 kD subunit/Protein of unknown function (DUF2621)